MRTNQNSMTEKFMDKGPHSAGDEATDLHTLVGQEVVIDQDNLGKITGAKPGTRLDFAFGRKPDVLKSLNIDSIDHEGMSTVINGSTDNGNKISIAIDNLTHHASIVSAGRTDVETPTPSAVTVEAPHSLATPEAAESGTGLQRGQSVEIPAGQIKKGETLVLTDSSGTTYSGMIIDFIASSGFNTVWVRTADQRPVELLIPKGQQGDKRSAEVTSVGEPGEKPSDIITL